MNGFEEVDQFNTQIIKTAHTHSALRTFVVSLYMLVPIAVPYTVISSNYRLIKRIRNVLLCFETDDIAAISMIES